MTSIDLHPEELLDRARRGEASPEELRRLKAHLASCSACSFERAFARDSDLEAAPEADAVRRIARSSVNALLARSPGQRRTARLSRRFVLAAVAMTCFACAAAAAILAQRSRSSSAASELTAAMKKRTTELAHPRSRATAEAPPASAAATVTPSSWPAPPVIGSRPETPTPSASPPGTTAAELFARANAERRRGELGQAVDHYRELERTFPGSSEALVSRVALGRLLLDRLGNPAGALAEFDAYLARSSHGALREEALIGRALALGRLGRRAEERGAWHALLTGYPSSAYAGRARERLERLQTP